MDSRQEVLRGYTMSSFVEENWNKLVLGLFALEEGF